VSAVAGFVGNFRVTLADDKKTEIPAGAIIVATGASKADTADYLYGKSGRVTTQTELEKQLSEGSIDLKQKNIVMIQCAGSRNSERAYCSRICCSMAIKNALKIKRDYPDANVYVLYRDIRTYGFREKYYKDARQAGVIFIRFDAENPPAVSEGQNGLLVAVNSPDMAEPVEIETDTLVLSTGVQPPQTNKALAEMLKVPLNADGFFVEAHLKLRPVDFASEGIFLCGLAHSPKMLDENISQARAAAARAATVLSSTKLEVSAQVSKIDQEKCISCMTCVRACPYGAPTLNADRKAEIVAAKCMGCGICAAECPARAIQLLNYADIQFNAMIDELFKERVSG
jgi:heterodisulfide reductase subunit A2